MRILFREEGASRLKIFLWLLLLFVVVHVGFKLIPMYMDFWRMEDEINAKVATAQVAKPKDEELRAELVKKAQELELPIGPENFVIVFNEDRHTLKISTAWNVEVHFFWGVCGDPCIRMYHFQPAAEGPY
jgi:hypothetical protein